MLQALSSKPRFYYARLPCKPGCSRVDHIAALTSKLPGRREGDVRLKVYSSYILRAIFPIRSGARGLYP